MFCVEERDDSDDFVTGWVSLSLEGLPVVRATLLARRCSFKTHVPAGNPSRDSH